MLEKSALRHDWQIFAGHLARLMPVGAAKKKSAPRHDLNSCRFKVRRRKNLRHATTSSQRRSVRRRKICATPRPQFMPVCAATKKICATPRPQSGAGQCGDEKNLRHATTSTHAGLCGDEKIYATPHDWQIFAGHLARLMPVGAAKKKICATQRLAKFSPGTQT